MTEGRAHPWSIRWRLMRGVLGIVAAGWIGTMMLAVWALDEELSEGFDAEMQLAATTTLIAAEALPGATLPRLVGLRDAEEEGEDGALLRLSVPGAPIPDAPWPQPATDGFSDQGDWRVLRQTGDGAVVEVAQSYRMRREELFEAASALLILVLPMALLLIWGVTRTLSRTLAPVEEVATAIGARRPDDLSPVPAAALPIELQPLGAALNGHLARIEALRQSERRFVANAAHELRTPVASIRARLEQADPADGSGTIRLLDDLTRRVERLLQLSRSDAGLGLGRGPADLLRILRLLVEDAARRSAVPIRLDDGDMDRFVVAQDPDALAILLRNLIENAVEHGTGAVRIALTPEGRLTIENPTANPAFLDAAFDKGARSTGIGLGLSIVDSLSASMGVRVDRRVSDGLARVELTFGAPE